ncbi:DUF4747 family protein [Citrobacter rodentium]|jgi:hypothetical protein|uniref:DUF4747 family protein n=2 Tax=Citrobacter rodentium TaxID=67825 RepID=D2TPL3_CITRI|nr:DUF4747 family protein [Citrobacter rodentium]KIQ50134.1 hypothetical protein TA05_17275 [Citrobacter rodentium]QBY28610.1 DUF4747 family protein [Citrobacter rodentium]UHO29522.1 DUF4747 family protein [Citrobacter rodentium NBRC 105723 = DSM 16636]CBG88830.1 hypothetical protein ROD_20791 [Citrobacter rodentium ICC168]HAT8011929.1 DUF4747 family protein [Citrobacter rodentium NBRC 105723 = DSM 16636]
MARAKKLSYGAINITIHPHSPQKYVELFRDARKLFLNVNVHGDQFAVLQHFNPMHREQLITEPYEGEVVKYTDINKNGEWYSISRKELATDEEKEQIVIPDDMKPNVSRFSFIFLPNVHLLVYENQHAQKNISPRQMEKFLNTLFSNEKIKEKYGVVNVTSLTEPDAVERMLSLKGITLLSMVTRRPNPDDLVSAEHEFQERFKAIGVIEEDKTYKAERDGQIKPDKKLKRDALIAARNGQVEIKRKNESGHVERLSTIDKPLQRSASYDPVVTLPIALLLQEAYALTKEFISKLRE